MFFEINDKEPIYAQIIRHIKISLVNETLLPGDTIPSRRELAESLTVNPNTVQRAYRDMEAMGLIETVRNFPSKITTNEEVIGSIKEELLEESIAVFLKSMKDLKISKKEILELINKLY